MLILRALFIEGGTVKPHKKNHHSKIKKMEISDDFKRIYNYIESKYAGELETSRKKLIVSIILCTILFIISFALFIFLVTSLNIDTKFGYRFIGAICILIIMYGLYKYFKVNKLYKESFKYKVIRNLFQYINPNLTYYPLSGQKLYDSYLDADFKDDFNKFITDDYVEGRYNNVDLKLANIALENINDKSNFIYEVIFSVTKINKLLTEVVRIKIRDSIFKSKNRVEMDSNEFEKYFDVYSNSNILAMEILTHDVMDDLVNFYNTYKIKFEIVIKGEHIYIRFDTGAMFEPNILRKSNDMNTLWVYYNIINFTVNLTSKVNNLLQNIDI